MQAQATGLYSVHPDLTGKLTEYTLSDTQTLTITGMLDQRIPSPFSVRLRVIYRRNGSAVRVNLLWRKKRRENLIFCQPQISLKYNKCPKKVARKLALVKKSVQIL